ncbi:MULTISPECIES: hypothetical protein [unclassified Pseudovibrio]|uniref:hypothetical protein n=1 Tax=unclassified Pseudovibrio TaxID=2627060 RepID=UPI0007AEBE65|nr:MULTISPECIES: hypothetical protein [unclassified Pseudovibrio]KZL03330.1 hypothetical protein PsW74_00756 [Pseudovibrio sp. W74]KZL12216.1 hypothetical protein PsAD14_00383 [Pseudovibrio sp. Ad14]
MSSSVALSTPQINPHISAGDLENIKRASDRDHVGNPATRLWDKIVDWFCGTDRVTAKKLTFDLYSPGVTDQSKVKAFEQLRELAGANYQDNFKVYDSSHYRSYSVLDFKLEFDVRSPDEDRVEANLKNDIMMEGIKIPEQQGIQFQKDFDRRQERTFTFDSKPIEDMSFFDQFSPQERAAIFAVCHQGLFPQLSDAVMCMSNNQDMQFDISKPGPDDLRIEAYMEKDISMDFDGPFFEEQQQQVAEYDGVKKSLKIEAVINIWRGGQEVDLVSAEVLSQNEV